MMSFNQIMRWSWAFLVAVTLSLGLAGCEGDDGAPGAAGAAGADGSDGAAGADGQACWDLNGNGVGDLPDEDLNNDGSVNVADCSAAAAKVTPLESCGVCHSEGSFADASMFHALPPIEAISNVAFAVALNGLDLEVNFDLADENGAPLMSYDEVMRAYVNNGGTVTDYRDVTTMANNGGGNYTITIAGAAAEALVNNRWLFRIRDSVADFRTYFHADFPDNPFAADDPLVVGGAACQACHGPEGIRVHGSHFIASAGAEPCLTCHGATDGRFGEVPALAVVAHEYHSGLRDEITYPTYMNNCSVCHAEEAQLAAANSMAIDGEACVTCHGSIAGIPFSETWAPIHAGFTATTNCQGCHNGTDGIAGNVLVVTDVHNGARTERGGIIWDGVDTSVTEGKKFVWWIDSVIDDGENLAISWQATYDGVGVDPCNDVVGPGAPVFFVDNRLRVYRNYAQGDDFILGQSTGSPGGALNVNVTADNTECLSNVATTTIPVDDVDVEKGRIALGGRPLVVSVEDPAESMAVRVPSPTYDWLIGTSDPALPRRNVVDTAGKCLGCHVGSMYQHGGDRVDNVDHCILCHNSASNEKNVRVGMGVDASEAYDGKVGETFEMKTMLHRVHSAGTEGSPPYLVYRNRGIYAFAPEPPPNWEAGGVAGCSEAEIARGERDAFGSDPASSNSCQPHIFHAPTFPRSLNECTACHTDDFMVIPDQTKSMAATTDAGGSEWNNQLDDVLQGAATTACITCHKDGAAKGHAYQNSWVPQVFPEGRQTIIDAVD